MWVRWKPVFSRDRKRDQPFCPMTNETQVQAQDGSEAEMVSRY